MKREIKKQYFAWSIDDLYEENTYLAAYDSIEDAVSDNDRGEGVEVFEAMPKSLGVLTRETKVVKYKKPKVVKNGQK